VAYRHPPPGIHHKPTNKTNKEQVETTMKQIVTSFKILSALALLAFVTGCASTQHSLVSSGFKVITPSTPAQEAKLKALPPNKVTMIQKDGKTYYVFPDAVHNLAYVGGPKQYQAYQELLAQQKAASERLAASEINQDPAMDWGAWNGWNGVEGVGGIGGL
jgi:hypothetical protein